MIPEEYKHISIADLRTDRVLSVRASNCCRNARLETLYDVLLYYKVKGTFLNVRNSGYKTNLELIDLCEKKLSEKPYCCNDNNTSVLNYIELMDIYKSNLHLEKKNVKGQFTALKGKGTRLLMLLNDDQRWILRQKYNELVSNLSVRAKNRLKALGVFGFIEDFFFYPNHHLLEMNNIGKGTLPELIKFKENFRKEFERVLDVSDPATSGYIFFKKNKILFVNSFVGEFYKEHKYFPMFRIIEHYLRTSTHRDTQILIRSFPILRDVDVEPLSDIADDINLTRERVRQIRNRVFQRNLDWNYEVKPRSKDFKLIKKLIKDKEDWAYIEDIIKKNYLISGETDIKKILALENSNLTEQFALHIIKCVFKDSVTLFNGLSIEKENVQWKSTYLIPSYLTDVYEFQKGKVYFEEYLEENDEEKIFNIKTYITTSGHWINYDISYEKQVVKLTRDILINEFDIFPYDEEQECVVIPAMNEKHPIDIVYDILKANGEPMYLDEIFEEFKKILPHHRYSDPEQLRSSVGRNDKITHISRESLYALKEWTNVRTGTIRDAVLEFLEKNDFPQDFDSITEYVVRFFPRTYKGSIKWNLKLDKSNRFVYFKNDLVGLKLKKYPGEYEEDNSVGERKSVEQRITELEKFILRKRRFPYYNSQDLDEISLCRWYNRACGGALKLTKKQDAEFKRIIKTYADIEVSESEYNWSVMYDEYLSFLFSNNRVPTEDDAEGELHQWYQNTLNMHREYQLNRTQIEKLIQLMRERDNVTR